MGGRHTWLLADLGVSCWTMNDVSLKLIVNRSLSLNLFTPVLHLVLLFLYLPVCPGLCTCHNLEQSPNKYLLLLPFGPFSCLLPKSLQFWQYPSRKKSSPGKSESEQDTLLRLLDTALSSQASSLAQPSFTTANHWTMAQKAGIEGIFLLFEFGWVFCFVLF